MSKFYLIKTSYAHYYAEVYQLYDGKLNYMDKIVIGSKKKCLFFSIYFDSSEPNIDTIGYSEKCSIGDNMHGTLHMIKTGISFVKKMYQNYLSKNNITYFQLKDMSKIHCKSDYKQNLPNYYMMKYGKTWYEKHLGCYPHMLSKQKYEQDKTSLRNALKSKPDLEFQKKDKIIKEIYKDYDSLEQFFNYIDAKYDCRVFKEWLDKFVFTYMPYLTGLIWRVPIDSIDIDIIHLDNRPKDLFIHMEGGEHILYQTII